MTRENFWSETGISEVRLCGKNFIKHLYVEAVCRCGLVRWHRKSDLKAGRTSSCKSCSAKLREERKEQALLMEDIRRFGSS